MKIFKPLLLSTLLITPLIHAQDYTVKWGPLMNVSKTDYVDRFIHADKDQVTILKKNLRSGVVTAMEKYNKDFKLVYAKELIAPEKNTYILDAAFTGEKILSLFSTYDSKAKTTKYSLSSVDDVSNAKPTEWIISTVDVSGKGNFSNTLSYNSPDYKKKVYIIENQARTLKNASDKEFVIAVADENGKKVWQKTITNKGVSSYFSDISELAVNSKGDVVLVEKRYNEDNEKKKDIVKVNGDFVSGYEYNLYIFSNNGSEYKKVNVDLGERFIKSVNTEVNQENDNFQFAGMYSNGRRGVIQGIFFGEIDTKGQVIKSSQKDFTNEFLDSFKKGATAKEKGDDDEGLSSSFKLRRFLSREDGGAYIVFEYYKLVVTTTTDASGRTSTRYTYYYNDVIVTSINKDGKIDWNYRIPKYQVSGSYIFSSIVPFVTGNTLGVIYNENPKNMDNEFDDNFKRVNFKDCVAIVRTLDPSGKLTSSELFRNKEYNTLLQPTMCQQTSPNSIAIYGGKFGMFSVKDARLGVITIK